MVLITRGIIGQLPSLKISLPWTHVSDLKYWDNEASQLYAVNSIPANFLLDPEGVIIGKDLRGDSLPEKLAEVFRE